MNFMTQFFAWAGTAWTSMGAGARVTLVSFVGGGIVLVAALGLWSSKTEMVLLYAGLTPEDAAAISLRASDDKIPFRYEASRGAILVAASQVDALKLSLAAQGLPRSTGGVGFEIFDKQSFGATDFLNRINTQIALQGTLQRSIQTLDKVASAQVILSMADPDHQVFARDANDAKASVTIRLRSKNDPLTEENIGAIRYLVSSSVPKLEPRSVSIVVNGVALSRPQEADDAMGMSSEQLGIQKRVEKNMVEKVEAILNKVVGPDKYAVRVNAQLNFDRKESTAQIMDPEQKLVTEETSRKEDSKSPVSGAGGAPGVSSNSTGGNAQPTATGGGLSTKTQTTTTNKYQYAMKTERVVPEVGAVKKLTVAVVVAKEKDKTRDLTVLKNLIQSAVGAAANDVKVEEQEFPAEAAPKEPEAAASVPVVELLRPYLSDALAFVGILVMAFVLRRMFSKMTLEMPTTADIGPAFMAEQIRGPSPQEELRQVVSQKNPQAVDAIRSMLK